MSNSDINNQSPPKLISWKFDDDPKETTRKDYLTWVEVSLEFCNNTKRWCILYTPDLLKQILNRKNISPPGLAINSGIIARSLKHDDVDQILRYLDKNNELINASLPLDDSDLNKKKAVC